VTFKPSLKEGVQKKSILVVTNDPTAKNLRLKVSASVEMMLAIKPARIVIPQFIGKDGSTEPLYAQFTGTKSNAVNIVSIKSANKLLDIEIDKEGFDGDTARQIKIKVLPGMPVGRFREKVIFKTDNTSVPTLQLYVMGESIGNIMVSPRNLPLGRISPESTTRKTIRLRSANDTFTFNVADVSSTVEEIATELITVTPGKEYQVVVSLPDGTPNPIIRGNIIIKTDSEEQKIITVRVFGHTKNIPGRTRSKSPARSDKTEPRRSPNSSKELAPM